MTFLTCHSSPPALRINSKRNDDWTGKLFCRHAHAVCCLLQLLTAVDISRHTYSRGNKCSANEAVLIIVLISTDNRRNSSRLGGQVPASNFVYRRRVRHNSYAGRLRVDNLYSNRL